VLHAVAGLTEVFRYHLRAAFFPVPIIPDSLDVALCLTQSATNLALAKTLLRGDPSVTRPSYQAGAVLRPALGIAAFVWRDPWLHRASVKVVNGFLYTRLGIWACSATGLWDGAYAKVYALSVYVGAVLAVMEGGGVWAVYGYNALVLGVFVFNRGVSRMVVERYVCFLPPRFDATSSRLICRPCA
jgi:hypothetical protein